ncbi:hypothetical protein [Streptomyces sirii]|uniref:hypothetical protein n=1 Tax=Streptomyces sirii TaxID=3127701 RepID=UPI003D3602B0
MIRATELTADDNEHKAFAWEVIKKSNDVVVSFAKLMATVALTAVGVVLTLARLIGLQEHGSTVEFVWLTIACAGYLAASLLFSYAVRGKSLLISPDDFDDVVPQFLAAAHSRHRATTAGLLILGLATITAVILMVCALASATSS